MPRSHDMLLVKRKEPMRAVTLLLLFGVALGHAQAPLFENSVLLTYEGAAIDVGNYGFGGHETLTVFEDVFVPWDRVFMDGEYDLSIMLVERFAAYHRQSYGG